MKKYILSALVVSTAAVFTSCNDALDTNPRPTEMTSATFPGKSGDVESELAAIYSIMNTMGGGDSDTQNPFFWWEVMSDNCYGSGGLQDNKVKSLHHLVEMNSNQYEMPFTLLYGGISRANNTIETIDNVVWTDKDKENNLREQLLGEAFFMRGLYTLWLTQLFGDVPLITQTTITPEIQKQVSAEEVIYPQILSDFTSGISLMGTTRGHGDGHANKYAAEAFIARAYMFWAGFYKGVKDLSAGDATIELVEQEGCPGGSISKSNIVTYLQDIVNNGGYQLCKDYRSLWQYSNSLLWDEAHDGKGHAYDFIADMPRELCFDQPGMGNGNTEEIFQIGNNGNRDCTYPFTQGWGQGTPSCNIWDDWTVAENNGGYKDIRKLGSLIDCDHECAAYSYVKDDCEESGYGVKKFNSITLDALTGDSPWWDALPEYSSSALDNPMQGDHFEDYYLMRYADVLLMLSELTGDAKYMNQVQARAGVPQTAYSLTALQNERRWEFAFEGLRFNDMRRWSGCDNHSESSYAAKALQAQSGKLIVCLGDKANKRKMEHMTCSWSKRYADTKGFLAKPQSQINLMNGDLEQNPGWDGTNPETQYRVLY